MPNTMASRTLFLLSACTRLERGVAGRVSNTVGNLPISGGLKHSENGC